jgi:hypothetical protein
MKIKQILLSQWNRFLSVTGIASVIEVLELLGEEANKVDSRK